MNLFFQLKKDAFLYSRKRKESSRKIFSSIFSIAIALFVALLIATALGYQPWTIFIKLFSIGFEDPSYLFYKLGVYALAGFSFYFAWKCGIINIGISGQMLAAGTVVVILTNVISKNNVIPEWVGFGLGQLFILIIAIIVAAFVAFLIGLMQNYLKINGVVSAILLNWIIYFISFFILATYFVDSEQFANSVSIPDQFRFYDVNHGTGAIIPVIIICVVIAIILALVFKYTVFGHKIKSIGFSTEASKFAGYNIKKLSICSFVISGAIAGILACICYSATIPAAIPLSITFDSVPSEGFEGIMIALVGGNNPFGILAASFLFGLFESSTIGLPTDPSFNDVIVGLVMLGSALSIIVIKWRPFIKLNAYKYDIQYFETQTTFDNSIDSLLSKYSSIYHNAKHSYVKKTYKKIIKDLRQIHKEKQINNKELLEKSLQLLTKDYVFKKNLANQINEKEIYQLKEKLTNRLIDNKEFEKTFENIKSKHKSHMKYLKSEFLIEEKATKNEFLNLIIKNKKELLEVISIQKERYKDNRFQEKIDFKKYKKILLKNYMDDKARVIDTFNYNKIQNLINKKITTQEIIDIKRQKISNKYDISLTKYLNHLKQRNNKNLNVLSQKAKEKSNNWKFLQVNKMILKQNKIIDNDELFNKEINKIKKLIKDKIKSTNYVDDLNKKINAAIELREEAN